MSADLPPEAFTKETLQEAFQWLQTQPELVRNSVHTKERLVSLFRRSQRLNDGDHPVSSKKFITDLKNLATSLDQFNGRPVDLQPPPPPFIEPDEPTMEEPRPQPKGFSPLGSAATPLSTEETTTETVKKASIELTTNTRQTTTRSLNLDSKTEERIQAVMTRFNLSSREEALRLLVSLGYEKFIEIP